MDLLFTEQQKMLQTTTRDFLARKCNIEYVRRMEIDDKGYSSELWKEMAELGWMGLAFPVQYGGSGMNFFDLALLYEETGRACLPGPLFSTLVLGGLPILYMGSEQQKQEFLAEIASGNLIMTMALPEPNADYDFDHMSVKAVNKGGHYVIQGTKLFVPDAHVANYLTCVAKMPSSRREKQQFGLFIVDAMTRGISHFSLKTIASDKQFEIVFDNVEVPIKRMVGEKTWNRDEISHILEYATTAKCAEMLGGAQQVLEMSINYAKERTQFGRPIGGFQAIQHYCANMLIDINSSRLATYRAAWMLGNGLRCTKEVSVAKAWVSDAYRRVCTFAHQIHGAIGFTKDHDLQLFSRRAKAGEIVFGNSAFHREVVAQQIGL